MGMFDSIMVPCPTCGTHNEFQTKSGDCVLACWELKDAPANALADVNRHAPRECENCGAYYEVNLQIIATPVLYSNPDSQEPSQ